MGRRDGLVWIDLEMSGLDPDRERILEIATLFTDANLNILAEGPHLVIHQPDEILGAMDSWNTEQHGRSGLIDLVRQSSVTEAQAEAETLAFLEQCCPKRTTPLAGNSVGHDRRFLRRYLPSVDAHLHYRVVDVSSLKELAQRWHPSIVAKAPPKGERHRAMDDIRESIRELHYYRENLFRELNPKS